jgi:glutamine amidotransferase
VNVALVDYGAGNLTSVIKALEAVGATVDLVSDAPAIAQARAIVIPGVGHFSATASLGTAWMGAVRGAIDRRVPLLGICLGLQWLFEGSAESPETPGLGFIKGSCFRIEGDVKVPHVGWNSLDRTNRKSRLLEGIPSGASAYFTHSYAAPCVEETIAQTTHAVPFSAAVERDNVFAVQFHPEKSGATGLTMLTNFLRIAESTGSVSNVAAELAPPEGR